jgi:hypothetical protein
MSENVIVTSDASPKKKTGRQKTNTAADASVNDISVGDTSRKLVFYSSGSGYVTKSGFKFSPSCRIYELANEEADFLLTLDNFRLPDQLEIEEYYKENK